MKKKNTKNTIKSAKDLWIALRPLSLTLSLASTTMGILMARQDGFLFNGDTGLDLWKIVLITIAGMSVLGSANLINDFYEGSFKYHRPGEKTYRFSKYDRTAFDMLVFAFSMLCILLTAIIGLILMNWSTHNLIYIGLIGIAGAYAYTGEPFVYKRKGLGAVLSLILVGSLMVEGSYMVFSRQFSWSPILYTLPAGLMIPLMMFSNEIRDVERDKRLGIKTFTVIFGKKVGKLAYIGLLVAAYALTLTFVIRGKLPLLSLSVLLTLPLSVHAYRTVSQKTSGIRVTNWLHIAFNLLFIASLSFSG
ncbi:prenyltransferase [Alkalibacter rhizosphaerae]|uniref:Prenyltransferase n=1 Tax=Alkalibacter rhizosphaerae TaxID=2815577 RepID=A0A974XFV1_9FIRM|nr:prenyltransferase [Alkalibacter rhizosphaerae]QSX09043.1 prenyltransferase [Alkalibacter rhizosphaerae]